MAQETVRSGRVVERYFLFRLPVAHVEGVGYEACTGFQIAQQLRTELKVYRREQEQRDHGRGANFGLEQILFLELHQVFHARFLRVLASFLDPLRVDINTDAVSAVRLCGGDDDAAVTAAKIVDGVGLSYARKF